MKVLFSCLLEILQWNHTIRTFRTPDMLKTLHLPQVRLAERVSKFKPTCSFIIMPKMTSITKWSSVKLEIWVLSFQWLSFSPRGGL